MIIDREQYWISCIITRVESYRMPPKQKNSLQCNRFRATLFSHAELIVLIVPCRALPISAPSSVFTYPACKTYSVRWCFYRRACRRASLLAGVIVFIRLFWLIGIAGVLQTLLIVLICSSCVRDTRDASPPRYFSL